MAACRWSSLLFLFVGWVGWLPAQKPLTHDDYDQWRSLRGTAISGDGAWVAYQLEPQFGDPVLEVRQSLGDVVHRHPLGSGPRFSADNRYCVFTVVKSKVEERDKKIAELRKKKGEKTIGGGEEARTGEGAAAEPEPTPEQRRAEPTQRGPGPRGAGGRRGMPGGGEGDAGGESRERGDLAILELATGKVEIVKRVKGFTLPAEAAYLVYHLDAAEEPKPDSGAGAPASEPAAGAAAAKPAGEQPVGAQPAAGKPSGEQPANAEPVGEQPAAEKPAAEKPVSEPPAAEPPATETRPEGRPEGGRRGGRRGPGGARAGNRPAAPPADPMERKRKAGTALVVRDLATGVERRLEDVVSYGFLRKSTRFYYHVSTKKPDAGKTYGLFAAQLDGSAVQTLVDGVCDFSGFTSDRRGTALAFTSNKDDFAAEKPRSDLWLWDGSSGPARRIVHPGTEGVPAGKQVGGGVTFARDGGILLLSLQDPPREPVPEVLADEKVVLDIWHWNDGELQTAQARGGRGRNESVSAVWHRDEQRLVVLGDDTVGQARFVTPDGARAIGTDNQPYEKLTTWDGRYGDVWLINTIDGSRRKVLERLRGSVTNSPGGRYLAWFGPDYHWWVLDLATMERRNLTASLAVAFQRADDDHPEPDPAHGIAGWTKDDAALLVYDEFDVWQISPRTGDAICVTDGYGRANRIRLRVQRLPRDDDEDDDGSLAGDLLLSALDVETMAEGFYGDSLAATRKPQRLCWMDKNIGELRKGTKADRLFLTLSTFADFPDLWTCERDFSGLRRLSTANPQQSDFRWGKAELVRWTNGDGQQLKGVLVKPDGFDPTRKYPMLVYFYERMSQNLHSYVAPAPGTSPNASYYVSNGYLFFMPDIHYEVGYPGESCVKCVVSGVQHLIAQGFVDERAIGAAGHSWGGYQTAFLVTRTNIFAAVESGAPVSNMISAYGGIRYETGVSRQFQYEQTQSRIGGTPWEFPLRYWENSPIHFADKVRTPVLILHNDQDGAVPWTQGIEYFMALRRLGRETYLFNYVGEPHGLRKRANQEDWSRRMSEYFAHHLRREPMPAWMQAGVPYSEREREKLAHTKSYLEVYVNPAPTPVPTTEAAAAGAADVGAKAVPAVSTGTEPAAVPASGREPEREKQQRERQQEE